MTDLQVQQGDLYVNDEPDSNTFIEEDTADGGASYTPEPGPVTEEENNVKIFPDPIDDSPGGTIEPGPVQIDSGESGAGQPEITQNYSEHQAAEIATSDGGPSQGSDGVQIAGFNLGTGAIIVGLLSIFLIFNTLQKK